MEVDLPDSNIWIYVADHEADSDYSQAHELYNEAIEGDRAVCIPPYVLAEFYRKVDRVQNPDGTQATDPYAIHVALWQSDTVFCPMPARHAHYMEDIPDRRRQPETYTISELADMEAKDAPIIAYAAQVRNLVEPNSSTDSISEYPPSAEAYRLKNAVDRYDPDEIAIRVLTYESDFVPNGNLSGIDGVYVENYQAD